MIEPQQLDAADGSSAEQQDDGSPTVSAAQDKTGNSAVICEGAEDGTRVSPNKIRAKHARHLAELIDRGKDLAIEMFDDAGNREFEETRRIQFVRLADRVSETVRKLIVSYDRHRREVG